MHGVQDSGFVTGEVGGGGGGGRELSRISMTTEIKYDVGLSGTLIATEFKLLIPVFIQSEMKSRAYSIFSDFYYDG